MALKEDFKLNSKLCFNNHFVQVNNAKVITNLQGSFFIMKTICDVLFSKDTRKYCTWQWENIFPQFIMQYIKD